MNYYASMFVGSNKQEIKVAFDTMTPLSLINSANCQGCSTSSDGYEYQRSYTIRKISDEKVELFLEGVKVKGVLVSDNFWLDKENDDTIIKEYPFMLVNYWS